MGLNLDSYKCSHCDTRENVSLRDLGFEEYIPICIDCFVEWSNIQRESPNFSVLLTDIELYQNKENTNTFDIFFDFENKLFHAVENTDVNKRTFVFKMVDTEENIALNHRDEILNYCLCKYDDRDSVGLGDIFIQGEYIKLIDKF